MTEEVGERRRRALTEEDVVALAEAFHARQPSSLAIEVHVEHHAFLEQWIAKEKRKQELYEKVKAHVMGWGIVSLIVATIGGLGATALEFFRSLPPR
jgi:hypothetical protein